MNEMTNEILRLLIKAQYFLDHLHIRFCDSRFSLITYKQNLFIVLKHVKKITKYLAIVIFFLFA